MTEIDLSGKTAVITGGSQGLGAVTAETLHRAGANTAINYFPDHRNVNMENAQRLAEKLGERAAAFGADVRDREGVARMAADIVDRFGSIEIVINNAGIIRDKTLKKMTAEEWHAVIDTNLTGTFNVCQSVTDTISEKGRIVNFASISGVLGFFGQSNYAASKAGVIALTKVMSKELGKRQITVNAVAPGVVLTEMGASIPQEVRNTMLPSIPLGRFGTPQEIADVVLFLCSDFASYVTGQVIHINGGWTG
jgi:3-oxoacyl-[acyl-carrier protein] reductase